MNDTGFTLQIDAPYLAEVFSYGTSSAAEKFKTAGRYVGAINRSLRDIAGERVRLDTLHRHQ
jgi:hypothetical protein